MVMVPKSARATCGGPDGGLCADGDRPDDDGVGVTEGGRIDVGVTVAEAVDGHSS